MKKYFITYVGTIDQDKIKKLIAVCAEANKAKPDELHIALSSPGGDVQAGITLYNFLKSLSVKVVMYNIGTVSSISGVIFMAGEERYAAPNTSFLFHGVKGGLNGSFTKSAIKELLSQIEIDEEKIAGILYQHTKLKKAEILKLMQQGEAKNAAFAKEKEIIHDIKSFVIPKGAPSVTCNFG